MNSAGSARAEGAADIENDENYGNMVALGWLAGWHHHQCANENFIQMENDSSSQKLFVRTIEKMHIYAMGNSLREIRGRNN